MVDEYDQSWSGHVPFDLARRRARSNWAKYVEWRRARKRKRIIFLEVICILVLIVFIIRSMRGH